MMLRNKGTLAFRKVRKTTSHFIVFKAFGASDDDLEYFVANGGWYANFYSFKAVLYDFGYRGMLFSWWSQEKLKMAPIAFFRKISRYRHFPERQNWANCSGDYQWNTRWRPWCQFPSNIALVRLPVNLMIKRDFESSYTIFKLHWARECPCVFAEIIRWCPLIEQIISDGKLLIEQTKVHDSSMGPVSVLLEGKTSVL